MFKIDKSFEEIPKNKFLGTDIIIWYFYLFKIFFYVSISSKNKENPSLFWKEDIRKEIKTIFYFKYFFLKSTDYCINMLTLKTDDWLICFFLFFFYIKIGSIFCLGKLLYNFWLKLLILMICWNKFVLIILFLVGFH